MRWVTWYNYKRIHGARGEIRYKKKVHRVFFGGTEKRKLMQKAYRWVIAERKKLGMATNDRIVHLTYKRKSNDFPIGVSLTKQRGRSVIKAYANVKKWKQEKKGWHIRKHGFLNALKQAIKWRKEREAEILSKS